LLKMTAIVVNCKLIKILTKLQSLNSEALADKPQLIVILIVEQ
jgi:hypothetical protein